MKGCDLHMKVFYCAYSLHYYCGKLHQTKIQYHSFRVLLPSITKCYGNIFVHPSCNKNQPPQLLLKWLLFHKILMYIKHLWSRKRRMGFLTLFLRQSPWMTSGTDYINAVFWGSENKSWYAAQSLYITSKKQLIFIFSQMMLKIKCM